MLVAHKIYSFQNKATIYVKRSTSLLVTSTSPSYNCTKAMTGLKIILRLLLVQLKSVEAVLRWTEAPISYGGSSRTTWLPSDGVTNPKGKKTITEELTSEGSVSISNEGESDGGANTEFAM